MHYFNNRTGNCKIVVTAKAHANPKCFILNRLFDLGNPVASERQVMLAVVPCNAVQSSAFFRLEPGDLGAIRKKRTKNAHLVAFQRKEESSRVPEGNLVLFLNVCKTLQACKTVLLVQL